jgi:hypothetical protein
VDEDLGVFFDAFAVAAVRTPAGGSPQTAKVLFNAPDQTVLSDSVMTTEYAITLQANDFPGLKRGETVTVAGTNYKVREVQQLDDGLIKQATLEKM